MVTVIGVLTPSLRAKLVQRFLLRGLSDVFDFPYVKRSFSLVHAYVYRLMSPIIMDSRSMKTHSYKTVQFESFSFVTRVPFSTRKSLTTTDVQN